jgi:hypothetical protein
MTLTAAQSSEKVLPVPLATSIILTRKFVLFSSVLLHVLPHVSAAPPRVYVTSLVVRVLVDLAVVQDDPPSQES